MNKFALVFGAAASVLLAVATPVTTAQASQADPVSAMARLDELNNQLEHAGGVLDSANLKLATDQQQEAEIAVQINSLARLQYKRPILLIQFLEANSVSQVLGDLTSDRLMATKERNLLLQARDLRRQDQQARDEANLSLASIKASRDEAQKVADEAIAAEQAEIRARALAIAQAPALTISRPVPGVGVATSGPNRFAYGYCTWYVANRRYIPWLGNAIDWWPNARPYGFAEGGTPRVGAVMVTRESGYGHVAYVESVSPNGSWTVSEMNFVGWNVVSSRTIQPGQVPLVGFIY